MLIGVAGAARVYVYVWLFRVCSMGLFRRFVTRLDNAVVRDVALTSVVLVDFQVSNNRHIHTGSCLPTESWDNRYFAAHEKYSE